MASPKDRDTADHATSIPLSERDLEMLALQLAGWNLSELALYFDLTEGRMCHEMNRIHNIANKNVDFSKFRGMEL